MASQLASKPKFSMMISTPGYQNMINNTIKDPARRNRFVSAITSAVAVNPALQECESSTILSGALLGESLNLSPSPQLGQYYLVPFDDRKAGVKKANFILSYRGMIQLALRSGYYKHLNVLAVKEGELTNWNPLLETYTFTLIEDEDQREKAKTAGYLACFEYLNGFQKTIYWSYEKMLNYADRYSAAFSKEATGGRYPKVSYEDYRKGNYPKEDDWKYSSFWYKQFDDMACKTMLRQLISKWGVMSIDMQTAFEADSQSEELENDFLSVEDENTNTTQAETKPAVKRGRPPKGTVDTVATPAEPVEAATPSVDEYTGEVVNLEDL